MRRAPFLLLPLLLPVCAAAQNWSAWKPIPDHYENGIEFSFYKQKNDFVLPKVYVRFGSRYLTFATGRVSVTVENTNTGQETTQTFTFNLDASQLESDGRYVLVPYQGKMDLAKWSATGVSLHDVKFVELSLRDKQGRLQQVFPRNDYVELPKREAAEKAAAERAAAEQAAREKAAADRAAREKEAAERMEAARQRQAEAQSRAEEARQKSETANQKAQDARKAAETSRALNVQSRLEAINEAFRKGQQDLQSDIEALSESLTLGSKKSEARREIDAQFDDALNELPDEAKGLRYAYNTLKTAMQNESDANIEVGFDGKQVERYQAKLDALGSDPISQTNRGFLQNALFSSKQYLATAEGNQRDAKRAVREAQSDLEKAQRDETRRVEDEIKKTQEEADRLARESEEAAKQAEADRTALEAERGRAVAEAPPVVTTTTTLASAPQPTNNGGATGGASPNASERIQALFSGDGGGIGRARILYARKQYREAAEIARRELNLIDRATALNRELKEERWTYSIAVDKLKVASTLVDPTNPSQSRAALETMRSALAEFAAVVTEEWMSGDAYEGKSMVRYTAQDSAEEFARACEAYGSPGLAADPIMAMTSSLNIPNLNASLKAFATSMRGSQALIDGKLDLAEGLVRQAIRLQPSDDYAPVQERYVPLLKKILAAKKSPASAKPSAKTSKRRLPVGHR